MDLVPPPTPTASEPPPVSVQPGKRVRKVWLIVAIVAICGIVLPIAGFGIFELGWFHSNKGIVGSWVDKDKEWMMCITFDGDGEGFFCIWAERVDEHGAGPIEHAGGIKWSKTGDQVRFEGAVAKGTAILQDHDRKLSVSWEQLKVVDHVAHEGEMEQRQAVLIRKR